jgi:hypothetical protein
MTGYPYADAAGQAGQGLADKLAALGEPLLVLGLVAAGIVLLFSVQHGKRLLLYVLAGGFLLLGGWRLVVQLLKYLLGAE